MNTAPTRMASGSFAAQSLEFVHTELSSRSLRKGKADSCRRISKDEVLSTIRWIAGVITFQGLASATLKERIRLTESIELLLKTINDVVLVGGEITREEVNEYIDHLEEVVSDIKLSRELSENDSIGDLMRSFK